MENRFLPVNTFGSNKINDSVENINKNKTVEKKILSKY